MVVLAAFGNSDRHYFCRLPQPLGPPVAPFTGLAMVVSRRAHTNNLNMVQNFLVVCVCELSFVAVSTSRPFLFVFVLFYYLVFSFVVYK